MFFSISRSQALATVDYVLDFVPVVSTVTNLVDIFLKAMLDLNIIKYDVGQHYYTHLKDKSYLRCICLLVPVFGNIFIASFDLGKKLHNHLFPVDNLLLNLNKSRLDLAQAQLKMELNKFANAASAASGKKVTPEELTFPEGKQKDFSDAIKEQNLDKVDALLKQKVDPNLEDLGSSHFMHACKAGSLEICKRLLPVVTDINALDKFGNSSLMLACTSGNKDLVQFLLASGADLTITKHNGYGAFFAAAGGKNIEVFDLLLKHSGKDLKEVINVKDNTQKTLLHYVNDGKMIEALLNRVGDEKINFINAQDQFGYTPLHRALDDSKFDVAETLFDLGADPFICINDNEFLIKGALFFGSQFITGKTSPLQTACQLGAEGFVQKVIAHLNEMDQEKFEQLNYQNRLGHTALYEAIKNKHLKMANWLLDAGADPLISHKKNAIDTDSVPLMLACKNGDQEFVLKALDKIRNPEVEAQLLEYCAGKKDLYPFLEQLLSRTQLPDGHKAFGNALNNICSYFSHDKNIENDLAKKLIAKGADVNAIPFAISGSSLTSACSHQDLELVETLLNAGADVNLGYIDDRSLPFTFLIMSSGSHAAWHASDEKFEKYLKVLKRVLSATSKEKFTKKCAYFGDNLNIPILEYCQKEFAKFPQERKEKLMAVINSVL